MRQYFAIAVVAIIFGWDKFMLNKKVHNAFEQFVNVELPRSNPGLAAYLDSIPEKNNVLAPASVRGVIVSYVSKSGMALLVLRLSTPVKTSSLGVGGSREVTYGSVSLNCSGLEEIAKECEELLKGHRFAVTGTRGAYGQTFRRYEFSILSGEFNEKIVELLASLFDKYRSK